MEIVNDLVGGGDSDWDFGVLGHHRVYPLCTVNLFWSGGKIGIGIGTDTDTGFPGPEAALARFRVRSEADCDALCYSVCWDPSF